MQAVYYDPSNPSAGVIAAGFNKAYKKCPTTAQKQAVAAAGDAWHYAAAGAHDATECVAAAIAAGAHYGVADAVLSGLVDVGLGQTAEVAAEEPGMVEAFGSAVKEGAFAFGRGAKEVLTAPARAVEKIAEEGGKTVRTAFEEGGKNIRAPFETAKEGFEAAGKGTKGFFESLTTAQIVVGAVLTVGIVAVVASTAGRKG